MISEDDLKKLANNKGRREFMEEHTELTYEDIKDVCLKALEEQTIQRVRHELNEKIREVNSLKKQYQTSLECTLDVKIFCQRQREITENLLREITRLLGGMTLEQALSRVENVKRLANEVCNNSVVGGFECNICGCIVKNANINGQWRKNVKYCPNCGGKNVSWRDE